MSKIIEEEKLAMVELSNCPLFPDGTTVLCNQYGFDGKVDVAQILRQMVAEGNFNKLTKEDITIYRPGGRNDCYQHLLDSWCYEIAKVLSKPIMVCQEITIMAASCAPWRMTYFSYVPSAYVPNFEPDDYIHFNCKDGSGITSGRIHGSNLESSLPVLRGTIIFYLAVPDVARKLKVLIKNNNATKLKDNCPSEKEASLY